VRFATLALAGALGFGAGLAAAAVPAERERELRHLLTHDCGSCHGLTLKGGLGPALTPAALAGKSPLMLREVILHGRPGTPMPPWKDFLSADEAQWLAELLVRGAGP
jgi:cytochrome c55X